MFDEVADACKAVVIIVVTIIVLIAIAKAAMGIV